MEDLKDNLSGLAATSPIRGGFSMALLIGELSAQADCEVAFLSPGTSFMLIDVLMNSLANSSKIFMDI